MLLLFPVVVGFPEVEAPLKEANAVVAITDVAVKLKPLPLPLLELVLRWLLEGEPEGKQIRKKYMYISEQNERTERRDWRAWIRQVRVNK